MLLLQGLFLPSVSPTHTDMHAWVCTQSLHTVGTVIIVLSAHLAFPSPSSWWYHPLPPTTGPGMRPRSCWGQSRPNQRLLWDGYIDVKREKPSLQAWVWAANGHLSHHMDRAYLQKLGKDKEQESWRHWVLPQGHRFCYRAFPILWARNFVFGLS